MALVHCPECGRENVSDSARSCPGCGFDVRAYYDALRGGASPQPPVDFPNEAITEEPPADFSNASAFRSAVKELFYQRSTKQLTQKAIARLPKGAEGALLLLGYGNGSVVETLLKKTRCQICGVDRSLSNYKRAKKWNLSYLRGGRLQLMVARLENLVLPEGSFRYILAPNGVYEWEFLPQGFLHLRRLLEDGGTLLLPYTAPKAAARWANVPEGMTQETLLSTAEKAGFRLEEVLPCPTVPGTLLRFQAVSLTHPSH